MPRLVKQTNWRAIALDMSIESSSMDVLVRGETLTRPVVRVVFRTERGTVFSGPRISAALRKELEGSASSGPWLPSRETVERSARRTQSRKRR